ncbi:hypothetical protein FZEAL_8615 [Fusarium zealandicum]|uniref:Mid2 domain-containing protein n=1 Tax=Fusarium zealandicum TaxID=1053134 RepID=A0A8H4XGM3_9HYPO|nr:hypothetical protein FZEAL_8615 [Fusarium zealandicum]
MQLRGFLFLGVLLGAEASKIAARQNTDSDAPIDLVSSIGAIATTVVDAITSVAADPTTDSPTADEPTPTADEPTDSPTDDTTSADETTTADGDTTVTRTTTVTDANVKTVSRETTVMRTITSTVVVTSTTFKTTTVTSSDAKTATETIYETSTKWANEKRALNFAPQTIGFPRDLVVDAVPTITAVPEVDHVEEYGFGALRRGLLHKRATITEMVTITEGEDSDKTVFDTVSRVVISTVTSQSKVTKTITETEQADASTTVSTTITLTVTSTRVTTNVIRTATVAPSGEYGPAGTDGADSGSTGDSGSSGADEGLSTGAKAGIGAGCGVVGLAAIGAAIWFCLKKRRNSKNKAEYDDVFGSSEVPVSGPMRGGAAPNMDQVSPLTANSTLAPSRNPTKGSNPEGYRGTALGDGRAGFAKPAPYGRSYMPVSPETNYARTSPGGYEHGSQGSPQHAAAEMNNPANNTAELASDSAATRWHQNDAAEIDGNQVSSARGSAPPANVFEMPDQPYR